MSTTVMIELGVVAWFLLAIPVALFLARMIRLRDRHGPEQAKPSASMDSECGNCTESANGAESSRMRLRWRIYHRT